jgi:hypothetical protein
MPHRRAEQAAVALQRSLQRRSSRKAATPRTRQRQKNRQLVRPCSGARLLPVYSRSRRDIGMSRISGTSPSSACRSGAASASAAIWRPRPRLSRSGPAAQVSASHSPARRRCSRCQRSATCEGSGTARTSRRAASRARRGDGAVRPGDPRAGMMASASSETRDPVAWRPPGPGPRPPRLSFTGPRRMRWTRRSSVSL